ncbi:MAG: prepilin-type N-terminal cleavage/methylation domain-containing protein [Candidatus Gracilibacteria bacterium]|nr:prepilin-type N-terminal cleavage/methylation domain-containing protein [Candidatus Gracilibacteria bacterium]MDD2908305.1 prepilin-type N-terminal cleavage/methylation domain-containing protein [Candidatus Gracilibacteria bacterium]
MSKNKTHIGFTVVELLVGIVIFTIGILSAYLLVYSALNSSVKSRNEIIASNLARESIELIKNNRDSNWSKMLKWNKLDSTIIKHNPTIGEYLTGGYYKISNEYQEDTSSNPSINIQKLSSTFEEANENTTYILNPSSEDKTELCLDDKNRYTYDCSGTNKSTHFYSYIKIEKLKTKNTTITPNTEIIVDNAFKVTAQIINSERTITKYSISTIITDWKK